MYSWVNQPIALYAINESSYIFTGSAVIDTNNTSGFFPNQDNGVVAIYTIATYEPVLLQTQGLAYSYDGGYSFIQYSGNPVLDVGSAQYRDPKVIRYDDYWVMVLAYSQDFVIGFYTSPDLKSWTFASNFTSYGLLGLQYECPNLVEVPVDDTSDTAWLLLISINPGAPQGGSVEEYFLGTFNGTHFDPYDDATRFTTFAKDSYAGQFFYGTPQGEPAVSMSWASNWGYAQTAPTGDSEGWRSAMGLPRLVTARPAPRSQGLFATSRPYDLSPVLGEQLAAESVVNSSLAVDFSRAGNSSYAVYMNLSASNLPPLANISNSLATLNLTFLSPISGEYLRAGFYLAGDNYFFIDRGGARGFDNVFFSDKSATNSLVNDEGTWSMEALLDRSMFETFLDGGLLTSTSVFYPLEPLTLLSVKTGGLPEGTDVRVEVYAVESTWTQYEDENGTVRGNTTRLAPLSPPGNGTRNSTTGPSIYKREHGRSVYDSGAVRMPWS